MVCFVLLKWILRKHENQVVMGVSVLAPGLHKGYLASTLYHAMTNMGTLTKCMYLGTGTLTSEIPCS